jgi:hypothetical protein
LSINAHSPVSTRTFSNRAGWFIMLGNAVTAYTAIIFLLILVKQMLIGLLPFLNLADFNELHVDVTITLVSVITVFVLTAVSTTLTVMIFFIKSRKLKIWAVITTVIFPLLIPVIAIIPIIKELVSAAYT